MRTAFSVLRPLLHKLAAPLMLGVVLAGCGDEKGTAPQCTGGCDTPPAPFCDGDARVVSSPAGDCTGNTCVYPESRQNCAHGCNQGACLPEPTPCTGVTCLEPPADYCDGNIAVAYPNEGTCNAAVGRCVYNPTRTECRDGNRCFAGECRPDSCDFVTCDEPPRAACEGTVLREYAPRGVCDPDALTCSYQSQTRDCADDGLECRNGACVPDAECVGVTCNAPPRSVCNGDVAQVYRNTGACEDGTCSYEFDELDCGAIGGECVDGACDTPCLGVVCDAPPRGRCNGTVATNYATTGTCQGGDCTYTETQFDCADDGLLCDTGRCIPDPLCIGVPCNRPPLDFCEGDVAVFYDSQGDCARGLCSYTQERENCADAGLRCSAGACVPPCDGVVCITPPDDFCTENVATYYGGGLCADGSCEYQRFQEDCTLEGKSCINGFCRGSCDSATCTVPPAPFCDGSLAVTYASAGFCLDERCAYAQDLTDCADTGSACHNGVCLPLCPSAPCNAPPEPFCRGDVMVEHDEIGTCQGGASCSYSERQTNCAVTGQVCNSGECVDPCFDTICGPAPAPICAGDVLIEYLAPGVCEDGDCSYTEHRVHCGDSDRICHNGACVDACFETICNSAPAAFCDGTNLVAFNSPGICADGTCSYPRLTTPCASFGMGCRDGACVDLCIGAPACGPAPAPTCEGNTSVVYQGTGSCHAGECVYAASRQDCTALGRTCQSGACIDACVGVDCLSPPAAVCEGDDRITFTSPGTCAAGTCDYASTITRCQDSNAWCVDGACRDACATTTCPSRSGSYCADNVLHTYAGPASCAAGACNYPTMQTNCADDGRVCLTGSTPNTASCVTPAAACAALDCTASSAFCDGDELVEDTADGVCDVATGTCDYSATRTRTLCPLGQGCIDGGCRRVPQTGELVITELFIDADGTDLNQEWIELHNTTTDTLVLKGIEVRSPVSGLGFTINQMLMLPPNGYLVLASSASAVPSAGFVYPYATFNLRNRIDSIELRRNGASIDTVSYNSVTWSIPVGAALQLSANRLDAAQNNSASAWCAATNVFAGTRRGTPGAANRVCP